MDHQPVDCTGEGFNVYSPGHDSHFVSQPGNGCMPDTTPYDRVFVPNNTGSWVPADQYPQGGIANQYPEGGMGANVRMSVNLQPEHQMKY